MIRIAFSFLFAVLLAGALVLFQAQPLVAQQVRIFAAASLKTALDQIVEQNALDVQIAYGGSAAMARQVAQGAGADIVVLAHPDWMNWLAAQGALIPQSRCDLIGNRLVLAGPSGALDIAPRTAQDLIDRLGGGRLATGHLRSVPAGQYAAEFLRARGWLATLQPHLVETSNVRLALALVALGEAPLGFVYASDVAAEPAVRALYAPPASLYPQIRYPAALAAGASDQARAVFAALAAAQGAFEAAGFTSLPDDDAARCQ